MVATTSVVLLLNSYRYTKLSQLIDLQDYLKSFCNILPLFGFNSAKCDINIIQSFLLLTLVNEHDVESIVIKNADQFMSFIFSDNQLLDITNFPGGATGLGSFLKAYKTSETKRFFPYKWLDNHDKSREQNFPQKTPLQ